MLRSPWSVIAMRMAAAGRARLRAMRPHAITYGKDGTEPMGRKSGATARDYARIARRTTATLSASRGLVSAGFIASGTISVIVAAQLSGDPAWAGIASSVKQLGTAFAALAVAAMSDRIGRRWGLSLGLVVGALGAVLALGSILTSSLLLFLGGAVLLGVASAAMRLGRFAAAEVRPPGGRGRAISGVVAGGAAGSILGPLLIGPSSELAESLGWTELAGPYLVTVVLLILAALLISWWLRPDPRDIGRELADIYPRVVVHQGPPRPVSQILRTPAAIVAVAAMMAGQVAMATMTGMASLHMRANQLSLPDISIVASAHTLGMFAFSIVAGHLTDRWGRGPVILGGTVLLAVSCAVAPILPGVIPLAFALFLLGVGWNFSYVGGSALLADQLAPGERSKAQGTSDLLVGLATALASLGSGLVFASTGYGGVAVAGMMASVVPIALTVWWMFRTQTARGVAATAGDCPTSVAGQGAPEGFGLRASCQL